MNAVTRNPLQGANRGNPKGFFGIYVVTFALILSIALIGRVFGLPWRSWFPGAEGERSMIGAVSASVYTLMSFIN
jgi:light-harvesting complex 1 beta chain